MTIGGYKFAGKYCSKGTLSASQWALLMHKTKVAAFMAANTMAETGWAYDMTGSPDGNYHCLDAVGNNYVTVFKRQNADESYSWFAIYTLTKYTWGGTDTGAVKKWVLNNYSKYLGYYATSYYRISTSQIAYDYDIATDPTAPINATTLLPMGNTGDNSIDIGSNYYPPSNTSLNDVSVASFGFALKNDSVIMFQNHGSGLPASNLACSIASGHGFSTFVNPDDTCGIFAWNTQYNYTVASAYENAARYVASSTLEAELCAAVDGDTGIVKYTAKLGVLPLATWDTSIQNYPFQSISVFDVKNTASSSTGKGTIAVDLLALNLPGKNQGLVPSVYSTMANGNFLCIRAISGTSYLTFSGFNQLDNLQWNAAVYCGWDPSNPDITQPSAWTEYTE